MALNMMLNSCDRYSTGHFMLKKLNEIEVSIIVCHHKGDFIYKFVESIKRSFGVIYEIIVITSDDNLASSGISGCLVFNGPSLPAEKRNIGAKLAKGEYLAFFDDDVEVTPDCLLQLKEGFFLHNTGMVYGKIWNMEHRDRLDEAGGYLTNTGFIWSRAGQNDIDSGQYDRSEYIFSGKSASCMIRKNVFNLVMGFDEDFGILGEESDLSWRVWLYGYRVLYYPKATAYHAFNTSMKPANDYYTSSRVQYNGCRNYITMLIKNLETHNLWRILPIHLLAWVTAGLLMFLTGKFTQGANIFKGLIYPIRNIGLILRKRRKVQNNRVIRDKELFIYIYKLPSRSYYWQRFSRYIQIGLHG